jgi:hypothetical protein
LGHSPQALEMMRSLTLACHQSNIELTIWHLCTSYNWVHSPGSIEPGASVRFLEGVVGGAPLVSIFARPRGPLRGEDPPDPPEGAVCKLYTTGVPFYSAPTHVRPEASTFVPPPCSLSAARVLKQSSKW